MNTLLKLLNLKKNIMTDNPVHPNLNQEILSGWQK